MPGLATGLVAHSTPPLLPLLLLLLSCCPRAAVACALDAAALWPGAAGPVAERAEGGSLVGWQPAAATRCSLPSRWGRWGPPLLLELRSGCCSAAAADSADLLLEATADLAGPAACLLGECAGWGLAVVTGWGLSPWGVRSGWRAAGAGLAAGPRPGCWGGVPPAAGSSP
jgi:hypothetical protein